MKKHLRRIFCFAIFLVISPYMIVCGHAQEQVFSPAFKECRYQSAVDQSAVDQSAVVQSAATGSGTTCGNGTACGEGITCDIRTDKVQYINGESVLICLIVANRGSNPAVMDFSSGQQVDFWIESSGGEVWRASKHIMYIQALTSIELEPGEVEEFQEEWPQVNDEGRPVSPCIYEVSGQLMSDGTQYMGKTSVLITDNPCPETGN